MRKYILLLLSFLTLMVSNSVAQSQPLPATLVLKEAVNKATKENKKILLIFHASWCGWCHKMDSSLNDPACKDFFDKHYVIRHITVQESKGKESLQNPGGESLLNDLGGKDNGLPYWAIFDSYGEFLYNSKMNTKQADGTIKGVNVGCPSEDAEVKYFIELLIMTAPLSLEQQNAIAKRFRMNKQ